MMWMGTVGSAMRATSSRHRRAALDRGLLIASRSRGSRQLRSSSAGIPRPDGGRKLQLGCYRLLLSCMGGIT